MLQGAAACDATSFGCTACVAGTNWIQSVLFIMQNRTFGPCLAAMGSLFQLWRRCWEHAGDDRMREKQKVWQTATFSVGYFTCQDRRPDIRCPT
jgi:hypothetical protein